MTARKISFKPNLNGSSFEIRMDDIVKEAKETVQLNYHHLIGISILYWDHVLTAPTEFKLLWARRKSMSSIWFFLVRYLGFVGNLPVVLFSFITLSPKIFLVAMQVVISIVAILRTYAFYSRDKRVLACLIGLGVFLVAVCSWTVHGQHTIPATILPGCHLGITERTFVEFLFLA
ncbi:hypothetical protein R3P38DRAFT_2802218 [Favolaschia claudopus]|uniref:DUF6533 domain-containing protein n=1 Tax=Favolaschia claudopus TaxID=2862362 RepID=A0AAV9ZW57_9AGAR